MGNRRDADRFCCFGDFEEDMREIVDVFDLTSTLSCSRYEVYTNPESFFLKKVRVRRFSDVLIYPDASESRNQPPYLQERDKPIIRDLIGNDGNFCYDKCSYLADFFQQEEQDIRKIQWFFRALRCSSYVSRSSPADKYVILIPDNFDADFQEKILRACTFPRKSTFLLWRSIAACLGNQPLLKRAFVYAKEIKIVDNQQRYCDESILTLIQEGDAYIPQRKAYKQGSSTYPKHELRKRYVSSDKFYRHTTYCEKGGDCVVWDDRTKMFVEKNFDKISTSSVRIEIDGTKEKIKRSSLMDGAAVYIARKSMGKTTYYDECTGLYIVVQDTERAKIYAKELIPPNPKCKGGEIIEGQTNEDCFIEKGEDKVRFRLSDVNDNDVPLKVLDYDFKAGAMKEREHLKLYPSMIPGQGIARVRVDGEKQLRNPVELDLLEMEYPQPRETVNSLRASIKHSYPVDIPAVAADERLWRRVENNVWRYLERRDARNKKMFDKQRYANPNTTDVEERLNRINVFGYADGKELPVAPRRFDFERLFKYMADDYRDCERRGDEASNEVLAMISRTYQGNNPIFASIKAGILNQVIHNAYQGVNVNKHKMTACAYLLRGAEELSRFFRAFKYKISNITQGYDETDLLHSLKVKGSIPDFSGGGDWYRALLEMLITNADMLKSIDTPSCEECTRSLLKALISHHYHVKDGLARGALKVLLFLLMRRKYDKSFLNEECKIRLTAEAVLKKMGEQRYGSAGKWSSIVLRFIQGNGALDGIVSVLNDEQGSNTSR